jgi:hypothetical protein
MTIFYFPIGHDGAPHYGTWTVLSRDSAYYDWLIYTRAQLLAKQSLCTPYSVRSNRAGVHTCVLFVFGGLAGGCDSEPMTSH